MKFNTPFRSANILLPKNADMTKWSTVACDQYTGEPAYWERVEKAVGDSPSTLRLTLPEIYLEQEGVDGRIADINSNIKQYLASDVFTEYKDAMILLERTQADGKVRLGLVGAIDLEAYDYRPGSKSLVRATEATVASRIPPRLKIRENADIELPHIMILIDDPEMSVIEPLVGACSKAIYDFELMENGGHAKGYLVSEELQAQVDASLTKLKEKREMLFAMGDGNHSLATAKEHYERMKRANPEADYSDHPARYALCEIVNLHSPALEFEAIHRIVTGIDRSELIADMFKALKISEESERQGFRVHFGDNDPIRLFIKNPKAKLTVGSVQQYLDEYIFLHGGKIDYIHGKDVLHDLAKADGAIGFEFEPMEKSQLFDAVMADGTLPRKTFSMGNAHDKRFYLEAKKIK